MSSLLQPPTQEGTQNAAQFAHLLNNLFGGLPVARPARWLRLESSPEIRSGSQNPAGLRQHLLTHFPLDLLQQAGILVPPKSESEEPQLRSDLCGTDKRWIRAHDEAGALIDLVGEQGCLTCRTPPLVLAASDKSFRAVAAADANTAFVAFTPQDAAALQGLGFAATTATNLERLSKGGISKIQKLLRNGVRTLSEPRVAAPEPLDHLVLVAWGFAEARPEEPPGVQPVVQHLTELHRHLGVRGFDQIKIWRALPNEIERLAFAAEHGSQQRLRNILIEHADRAPDLIPTPVRPKPSLAHAYAQLTRSAKQSHASMYSDGAEVMEIVSRRILGPLFQQAENEPDPVEANQLLLMAELAYESHSRVLARHVRRLSSPTLYTPEEDRAELRDVLQIMREIRNLAKQADQPAVKLNGSRFRFKRR